MKKLLLLVGGSADALEAKRVVLEGAGFAVRATEKRPEAGLTTL